MFPATRGLLIPTSRGDADTRGKNFAEQLAIPGWNLLRREASYLNMRALCGGAHTAHVTTNGPMEVFHSR
jgi:hypothetical protein